MRKARIFKTGEIIDAYDVFNGLISRHEDFVDVEEDFRVKYWNGAKANGRPHFKIYLARDEYKRLTPEQKTRLEILKGQRHYQETEWHQNWEERFEGIAEIEKTLHNPWNQRKRADAYIDDLKLCLEFQHSFIDYDFEERNYFYDFLGIKVIWIYDLTMRNVKEEDGHYTILEDNARGFFKVAEKPENLKNNTVFIQAKDKKLYLIKELGRKEIDGDKKSTIRYFDPVCILDADEFVEMIKKGDLSAFMPFDFSFTDFDFPLEPLGLSNQLPAKEQQAEKNDEAKTLQELWKPSFKTMYVQNIETGEYYKFNSSKAKPGTMWRGIHDKLMFQYADFNGFRFTPRGTHWYELSGFLEVKHCWKFMASFG